MLNGTSTRQCGVGQFFSQPPTRPYSLARRRFPLQRERHRPLFAARLINAQHNLQRSISFFSFTRGSRPVLMASLKS